MTDKSKVALVEAFVAMTRELALGRDADEFVLHLVERTAELLGASDAGVLLEDEPSRLRVAASSSSDMHVVEALEVHIDEGPCYESFTRGEIVFEHELRQATRRWPRFAQAALDLGFESVYALPLQAQDRSIGSMNLFCEGPFAMSDADLEIGRGLADFASLGVRLVSFNRARDELTEQLQHALKSRVAIEQAKGMVAAQLGVDVDRAFALIRGKARREGRPLREVVDAVVDGTVTGTALAGAPTPEPT